MKRTSISIVLIHLFLLVSAMALLVASLLTPWAVGRAVIFKKLMDAYGTAPFLVLLPPLLVGITSTLGFYTLFSKRKFWAGLIIFILGLGTFGFGYYIWGRIEASDIYFLFKVAEVRPDLGVLLFSMAGATLVMEGVILLMESLLNRRAEKAVQRAAEKTAEKVAEEATKKTEKP